MARKVIANAVRFITAALFIFSGFVKAVDPLGTQYKINDYLTALGADWLVSDMITLPASMVISAFEFSCGVFLLFALRRKLITRVVLAFMAVMTVITLWIAVADPISDCGCFGDAIIIGNTETFLKNIVLMVFAILMCRYYEDLIPLVRRSSQWVVINYTIVFIFVVSGHSLYFLPQFDFRPYYVGADIKKGMEIPEDAEAPEFETTFIMEKDGVKEEFTLDNYPDSTWTFVDSRTVMTKKGYEPPIHDFSLTLSETGEDITNEILEDSSYVFLVVSPYLEQADDSNFGEIDRIYEYAIENGYKFYGVSSSGDDAVERWRDITGAEYQFCTADAITLKTVIRSNPGLVLLKNGVVIGKWSHNSLPMLDTTNESMDKVLEESIQQKSVARKILEMLLWFFLPLFLLTLADRSYNLHNWVRQRRDRKNNTTTDKLNI